jgi:HNH endonuclease/AP2 domain
MVAIDRLKELLEYNHETGEFVRKVRRGRMGLVGSVAGTVNNKGYVIIEIDGRPYTAHRLAWMYMTGEDAPKDIDHIDRRKNNNAWSNLRLATNAENHHNRFEPQRNNTSGYLGVTFHKASSKWMAIIKKHQIRHYLGLHETPEAAHEAYLAAKRKLHPFAFV